MKFIPRICMGAAVVFAKSIKNLVCSLLLCVSLGGIAAAADPAPPTKFNTPPLVALKAAAKIIKSKTSLVSADELVIFKAVADGRGDSVDIAGAALIASGIDDLASRRQYLARFNELTVGASEAMAGKKTVAKKAGAVMNYLVENVYTGKGLNESISVATVLDDGSYNCVSSATVFTIVASRLGLETCPVNEPGHVFLRLANFYVEPVDHRCETATHHAKRVTREAVKNKNAANDRIFGGEETFDTTNLGLVGEIYYDRATPVLAAGKADEAVVLKLKAACMAPDSPLVVYGVDIYMQKWFKKAIADKEYTKARQIAAMYGKLFGESSKSMVDQLAKVSHTTARHG
jgi:Transglutaminase-like superfamily